MKYLQLLEQKTYFSQSTVLLRYPLGFTTTYFGTRNTKKLLH